MITLYSFGPGFGLPDPSPFVTKAEVLLKMAELPYRSDTTGFKKAPKGKLPYIDDGGEIISVSTFIRWHLERKYNIDFDLTFGRATLHCLGLREDDGGSSLLGGGSRPLDGRPQLRQGPRYVLPRRTRADSPSRRRNDSAATSPNIAWTRLRPAFARRDCCARDAVDRSDGSFSRFQAVHDGTRADWARCNLLCLCRRHPMSPLRHAATHFGGASRESETLRGTNDCPLLSGSRRDRRVRGCGLEARNATTRRRFCRFSSAMIRQRTL